MATRPRFSQEVRERAVRLVVEHASEHPSGWAAMTSIAGKIGCSAQTLTTWITLFETDAGRRPGRPILAMRHLRDWYQQWCCVDLLSLPRRILPRRSATAAGPDGGLH